MSGNDIILGTYLVAREKIKNISNEAFHIAYIL